jgi:hypothetical protein
LNGWVISYASHTDADPATGGNFYLARYGILVEQASDTCVALLTSNEHGTTFADPVAGRENYEVSFSLGEALKKAKNNMEMKEALGDDNAAWK